jgi:hypothetical protein
MKNKLAFISLLILFSTNTFSAPANLCDRETNDQSLDSSNFACMGYDFFEGRSVTLGKGRKTIYLGLQASAKDWTLGSSTELYGYLIKPGAADYRTESYRNNEVRRLEDLSQRAFYENPRGREHLLLQDQSLTAKNLLRAKILGFIQSGQVNVQFNLTSANYNQSNCFVKNSDDCKSELYATWGLYLAIKERSLIASKSTFHLGELSEALLKNLQADINRQRAIISTIYLYSETQDIIYLRNFRSFSEMESDVFNSGHFGFLGWDENRPFRYVNLWMTDLLFLRRAKDRDEYAVDKAIAAQRIQQLFSYIPDFFQHANAPQIEEFTPQQFYRDLMFLEDYFRSTGELELSDEFSAKRLQFRATNSTLTPSSLDREIQTLWGTLTSYDTSIIHVMKVWTLMLILVSVLILVTPSFSRFRPKKRTLWKLVFYTPAATPVFEISDKSGFDRWIEGVFAAVQVMTLKDYPIKNRFLRIVLSVGSLVFVSFIISYCFN